MWRWLTTTDGFVARHVCGTGWTPPLVWMANLADMTIFLCYVAIPLLAFVMYRRIVMRQRPVRAVRLGLVVGCSFVLTCGLTHVTEAAVFWWPAYHLDLTVRLLCATCSISTVSWMIWNCRDE